MQNSTPKFAPFLLLCIGFILTKSIVKAQVFTENFSYGNISGSIDSLSSFWAAHRGAGTNTVKYETSSLASPIGLGSASGGAIRFTGGTGIREDINRSIPIQTSGTLYVSFLMNIDSANTEYFFHLNTSTHHGRVNVSKQNGFLKLACSKLGAPSQYYGEFLFNTTYLIVLKYQIVSGTANDTASMWVLSEPTPTEQSAGVPLNKEYAGNDPANLFALSIRQGLNPIAGRIDQLRIAYNWEQAVNTSSWNGSAWIGEEPNSQSNVSIQDDFFADTSLYARNIFIAANKKLVLDSQELHLYGELSGSGVIASTSDAGLHVYSNAGLLKTDAANHTFKQLYVHENGSLTLDSPVILQAGENPGTLRLANHASLQTQDQLYLASNALGSARIDSMGNGAYLGGKITVQKYIPARRAFRFLSSPVSTNNGIKQAWQENLHITGNGPGFDSTNSKSPSMFTLNAETQEWEAINNTLTQNLAQGIGYRIMVRGDRSINLFSNTATPTPVILSATGFHQWGDKTYDKNSFPSISDSINGFSLVGNPFPSAINWNTISKNNISSTYYTWRAQGGSNNRGAYVSYNAAGNSSSDGNINHCISSGAAFMIKTIGANPSITIREKDKIVHTEGSLILGKKEKSSLRLSLFEQDSILTDALYLFQEPNALPLEDLYDSKKWMNPGLSFYVKDSLQNNYSVYACNEENWSNLIELGIKNTEQKTYNFIINSSGNFNKNWILNDRYTGKKIPIYDNLNSTFSINQNPESFAENRFYLSYDKTSGITNFEEVNPKVWVYPNPCRGKLTVDSLQVDVKKLSYQITDLTGKIISKKQALENAEINTEMLG
ncbi:MAG: hypothetical protein MH472_02115, partial [Bacteroidia bacterium]|nr:hypothetical protein [Bacteroidia bacterium]